MFVYLSFALKCLLKFFTSEGEEVMFVIGSSLDVPRACMRANAIVSEGDVAFLSVNTNMLTELVYGMSRADTARLVESYVHMGIMSRNPFLVLDQTGVGGLLKIAKNLVKKSNRFIRMGVRGEQAADAASIEFFDALGMDYVCIVLIKILMHLIARPLGIVSLPFDPICESCCCSGPYHSSFT